MNSCANGEGEKEERESERGERESVEQRARGEQGKRNGKRIEHEYHFIRLSSMQTISLHRSFVQRCLR